MTCSQDRPYNVTLESSLSSEPFLVDDKYCTLAFNMTSGLAVKWFFDTFASAETVNGHPPYALFEERAPDSLQFNLVCPWTDAEARSFQDAAKVRGIAVQIFGLSQDNARAFWNWQFLGDQPDMPQTRAMLMRACDLRLPARLQKADLDYIAEGHRQGEIRRALNLSFGFGGANAALVLEKHG